MAWKTTHPLIYLEALWLTIIIANMVHIKPSNTLLAELNVLFNRLENRSLAICQLNSVWFHCLPQPILNWFLVWNYKFCTTLFYCQLTTPWCPYHPRLSTWVWISYHYLNKYLSQQVIAELKARSKNPTHFKKQLCHPLVSSLPLIGSSNRNDKQENLMENKILQKMIESEKLWSHTVPWPLNGHFNV